MRKVIEEESYASWIVGWGTLPKGGGFKGRERPDIYDIVCRNNTLPG